MWYYLLFLFVTVGAKLVLALAMIYYLLPNERTCAECDGETLLLGGNRGGGVPARPLHRPGDRRGGPPGGGGGAVLLHGVTPVASRAATRAVEVDLRMGISWFVSR